MISILCCETVRHLLMNDDVQIVHQLLSENYTLCSNMRDKRSAKEGGLLRIVVHVCEASVDRCFLEGNVATGEVWVGERAGLRIEACDRQTKRYCTPESGLEMAQRENAHEEQNLVSK